LDLGEDVVCRRGGEDKLLNKLTVKWSVNLLRIPREGIQVGDVFVAQKRILSQWDRLSNLYTPKLVLPEPDKQSVPDMDKDESQRYAADVGFEALQGFLQGLGVPPLPLRASIEAARHTRVSLSFNVGGVARTALLPGEIKREMERRAKGSRWGVVDPKRRYLVAHAVWTATSLQIKLEGGREAVGELSARLKGVAGATGKLKTTHDASGTIKYHRDDPVVFGIQVTAVQFKDRVPLLEGAPDLSPRLVRGEGGQEGATDEEQEAEQQEYGVLIGAKDGSPFVTLR
jgi:hypothetical protein